MIRHLFNSLIAKSGHCFSTSSKIYGKLSGKTAIVTASTDGIGFAIARKLGQDGAHVVISSRKLENVNKAVDKLKAENLSVSGMTCHVEKESDRKNLLEKVIADNGGLDIVVPNTGINPYFGRALATPDAALDEMYNINVKSPFCLIKEATPLLQMRGGGSIVIVSSIAAFDPIESLGMYSVSKAALVPLTKALTSELGAMSIRINCIAPGIIKMESFGRLWKDKTLEKSILDKVPLSRLGNAEDCGGIVSFLCSDEASYITGETVVVAGGMKSRM